MDTDTNSSECLGNPVPRSVDFLYAINIVELVFVGICTICTIAIVADFIRTIIYVRSIYTTSSTVKNMSLQVIGLYPSIATAALISLYVPRAALVSDLLKSVVVAMCLLQFSSLMTKYFGGQEKLLETIHESNLSLNAPPCCCCCVCLPKPLATEKNLGRIKRGILQAIVIQPILFVLILVLWLDDDYMPGNLSPTDAFPYMLVIQGASTLIAVWCMFIFFILCGTHLKAARILNKFLALMIAVFFLQMQGLVFDILVIAGQPKPRGILSSQDQANAYEQMTLIFEMTILTIVARRAYRQPHEVVSDMIAVAGESVEPTQSYSLKEAGEAKNNAGYTGDH